MPIEASFSTIARRGALVVLVRKRIGMPASETPAIAYAEPSISVSPW